MACPLMNIMTRAPKNNPVVAVNQTCVYILLKLFREKKRELTSEVYFVTAFSVSVSFLL